MTEHIHPAPSILSARKRGALFVFEGIDGVGKSTQLNLLAEALRVSGADVIVTREPSDSSFGKQIRSLYLKRNSISMEEELDLFVQDRRVHVDTLIAPALRQNKIVLCDRYYLSTMAYQGAQGMNVEMIYEKNCFAPEPDIAFLFEMPPNESISRITQNRGETPNDFEQEENLQKVAALFQQLTFPFIRRIDATSPADIIHQEVFNIVQSYFKEM